MLLVLVMATAGAVLAQSVASTDAVETHEFRKNKLDRSEIIATASGASSTPLNLAQARAMTERAAYVVALRNCLRTVKGGAGRLCDSVENYMVKSDVIKTRVEGIVQGARVVNKQYMSDGLSRFRLLCR